MFMSSSPVEHNPTIRFKTDLFGNNIAERKIVTLIVDSDDGDIARSPKIIKTKTLALNETSFELVFEGFGEYLTLKNSSLDFPKSDTKEGDENLNNPWNGVSFNSDQEMALRSDANCGIRIFGGAVYLKVGGERTLIAAPLVEVKAIKKRKSSYVFPDPVDVEQYIKGQYFDAFALAIENLESEIVIKKDDSLDLNSLFTNSANQSYAQHSINSRVQSNNKQKYSNSKMPRFGGIFAGVCIILIVVFVFQFIGYLKNHSSQDQYSTAVQQLPTAGSSLEKEQASSIQQSQEDIIKNTLKSMGYDPKQDMDLGCIKK